MNDKDNTLVEFEPISTNDNTELKVAIYPHINDDVNNIAVNDLKNYQILESLFRELPGVLFVDRVLKEYVSSEPDLGRIRAMLFDILREDDDFPFGLQAELKRRVFTRNGELVALKLANDIHVLLRVIEGGDDVSIVKEMLSSSRGRTHARTLFPSKGSTPCGKVRANDVSSRMRSLSPSALRKSNGIRCNRVPDISRCSNTPRPSSGGTDTSVLRNHECPCKADTSVLSSTMSQLQADMLLLKQRQAALEVARSSQMCELKNSMMCIHSDISNLKSSTDKHIVDLKSSVDMSNCLSNEEIFKLKCNMVEIGNSITFLQLYRILS